MKQKLIIIDDNQVLKLTFAGINIVLLQQNQILRKKC